MARIEGFEEVYRDGGTVNGWQDVGQARGGTLRVHPVHGTAWRGGQYLGKVTDVSWETSVVKAMPLFWNMGRDRGEPEWE